MGGAKPRGQELLTPDSKNKVFYSSHSSGPGTPALAPHINLARLFSQRSGTAFSLAIWLAALSCNEGWVLRCGQRYGWAAQDSDNSTRRKPCSRHGEGRLRAVSVSALKGMQWLFPPWVPWGARGGLVVGISCLGWRQEGREESVAPISLHTPFPWVVKLHTSGH